MMSVRSLLCRAALLLAACGSLAVQGRAPAEAPAADVSPGADVTRTAVVIETSVGDRAYQVEIARTDAQQERGLMFRRRLAKDGGMIFPFDPPRPASFWMRNTLIPLDMIFIRPDGTIARVAANRRPLSLDITESGEPVAAVLEIAGGGAARAGIREGDRVRWSPARR